MGEVFSGHRDPFDRLETARDTSKVYDVCLRNLTLPWAHQVSTDKQLRAWREGWPHDISDLADPSEAAQRKQLHDQLRAVDNPLGGVFADDWQGISSQPVLLLFSERAHWTATRIVVAARLYAADHGGSFPRSLKDIAGRGYLESKPIDPYLEGSQGDLSAENDEFHYDPVRKIIWSVGQDGHDDRGAGRPGGYATDKDLVWRISGTIDTVPQGPRPKPGSKKKKMMRPLAAGGMGLGTP
jgi:hypothetical protein